MGRKITQADRLRFAMNACTAQVMELLDWDMQVYANFKYECGLAYLQAYLKGDKEAIDLVTRSAVYWGWWKLHWFLREQEFLQCTEESRVARGVEWSKGDARYIYQDEHDPRALANPHGGWGKILDESYCRDLVREMR